MSGIVLPRYLAMRFVSSIGAVFLLGTAIILLADFLELLRRTSDSDSITVLRALLISALRTPSLTEEFLPFAVLFGSIAAFIGLSRRLELVVVRAAGVSVWQFAAPALVVAILIGMGATTIYNPLSATMKERANRLGTTLFEGEQNLLIQTSGDVWFRQDGLEGESIVHARQVVSGGEELFDVAVYQFDDENVFRQRINARKATLSDGEWLLEGVTLYSTDGESEELDTYSLSTFLTPAEVRETVAQPDAVPFWRLPGVIALTQRAGLPAYRYRLRYQTLLARPILLAAMVLIAATVSLRMARLGGVARAIAGGVAAGFVLYVTAEITSDLGGAGVISPSAAAWAPGLAAILLGVSILLHQEDG
ncbi:LPS export ABC transporter permease LptG [Amorphus orientalis]|uniref:Lipopolysaccharide export system permease protein n=1 Tax=Amorphus orientalis TaxID=649198 RepID=A0AAE4ASZ5_9HYPH|nr:LPS export ABC transporter permease LptG [Amorphus orientalis]MDQ0315627.1 lipopolysaccharide export system permease protein [Amorphus orientalis]